MKQFKYEYYVVGKGDTGIDRECIIDIDLNFGLLGFSITHNMENVICEILEEEHTKTNYGGNNIKCYTLIAVGFKDGLMNFEDIDCETKSVHYYDYEFIFEIMRSDDEN